MYAKKINNADFHKFTFSFIIDLTILNLTRVFFFIFFFFHEYINFSILCLLWILEMLTQVCWTFL